MPLAGSQGLIKKHTHMGKATLDNKVSVNIAFFTCKYGWVSMVMSVRVHMTCTYEQLRVCYVATFVCMCDFFECIGLYACIHMTVFFMCMCVLYVCMRMLVDAIGLVSHSCVHAYV